MREDKVVPLRQPGEVDDPLSEILREGARALLAQAIETQVEAMVAAHQGLPLAPDRHHHGLQANHRSRQDMAPAQRPQSVAKDHPGRQIPRRH